LGGRRYLEKNLTCPLIALTPKTAQTVSIKSAIRMPNACPGEWCKPGKHSIDIIEVEFQSRSFYIGYSTVALHRAIVVKTYYAGGFWKFNLDINPPANQVNSLRSDPFVRAS
jgi:hypothetical protein